MRKFVERTLAGRVELLLSLLALSFVPGAGDSGLEAQEPDRIPVHQVRADDLTPELDSLFDTFLETIRDSMTVHDVPGLSIAVVDWDRTLWSAGFGVRDRDSGEPVTPGTVFSVQSISKLFTGVTAMKAVEDGLLELDAVVTDYLPDTTAASPEASRSEPTPYRPEWNDYLGTYEVVYGGGFELAPSADRTDRRAEVLEKDGYLQLLHPGSEEPEPLIEHEPGLFFGVNSGEALDFRHDPPTLRNIELERVGPADTAALDLEECDIPGLERPARCGTLEVPEDRGHPDGRRIGLRVVLVPARERPAEPDPVFFLSGGPGQAATADAASEAGGPIGRRRDMVFVDQRGTGESRPLSCDLDGVQASADMYLAGRVPLDRVAGCLEKLEADPRHYWTGPAVEDLDDVRAALGYEEINLKGGSYGTRVAVVYARRHPEHTRTLLLSGVTPMSYRVPLPHPRESQRALDSLAAACEADRSCQEDYGDVAGLLSRVTADLERRSRTVTVSSPGLPESARITLDTGILRGAVHLTLYDVDTAARLPALLAAADRGDYGPLAAWAAGLTAQLDQALHLGMLFSVICAEDEPRISPSEVDPATEGTYLGGQYVRGILSACEVWPAAEVEDDYFEPVATEVPTLMISGAVDPVTPPRWAEAVERRLPNARHLVVPGRGHTPGLPECAEELPVRFLDRASADGLDAACLEAVERPAFEDGGAG